MFILFLILFVAANTILTLIANTTNYLNDSVYARNEFSQDLDYGSASTDVLFTTHLKILNHMNSTELILGKCQSPNETLYYSDIGYIKMITGVGIVGTILIIILHFKIWFLCFKKRKMNKIFLSFSNFIILSVLVLMIFNYKNLLLYSRGAYELFLLCAFVFLSATSAFKSFTVKHNASELL